VRSLQLRDRWVLVVLALYVATQCWGALWDLPGSHSWENDGIAPREVFTGLAANLTPGHAHRYPLFHYLLSLLAALPVLVIVPFVSPSLARADLLATAQATWPMTGVSLAVKALAIAASVVTLLALGRFARRASGATTARWAVTFAALNLSLSYYGRSSNLDGPYLMWIALALERLSAFMTSPAPGQDSRIAVYCALAVATKDQAYALALPLLFAMCLHSWCDLRGPDATHRFLLRTGRLAGTFVGAYALASGALVNPSGFVARVRLLSGPNSQDWKVYESTARGALLNLTDILRQLDTWWWPWPVLVLAALGLCKGLAFGALRRRLLCALPLALMVCNLVLFTLVVGRAEHRFLLPSALAASFYAGCGARAVLQRMHRASRIERYSLQLVLGLAVTLAAHLTSRLLFTQHADARADVSAWLSALPEGTRVEAYGLPVYLPHFDTTPTAPYRVTRVTAPGSRKPAALIGVEEQRDLLSGVSERGPDVLIIAEPYVRRFRARSLRPGERMSRQDQRAQTDLDATRFFRSAVADRLAGYRLHWVATAHLPDWLTWLGSRGVEIHGSTNQRMWVLVRNGALGQRYDPVASNGVGASLR